ncbi:HNH endonuclease [Caenimonas koreensis DSM 17982]|uniref:HNH endonuclease n=1 Tax=Caenimonas koreensis DSM 17982 TaxID=1121255 RepID=A0A844B6A0_9BURK|nr:HNH endonuclease [Caenimonas koreensis]MRD46876.1 HNH endonuclease [Caenimonas koreensis DSM 17982]
MPTPRQNWTRGETLAALHVYLLLPFGMLHHNQPLIRQLAGWIGRSPNSVALKLVNLASLDPQIVASGRKGMGNVSALDRQVWRELLADWDPIALQAASEYERLATSHGVASDADVVDELPTIEEGRTRMATVEVRVNQARFRKSVLAGYHSTCCISGLRSERLLVASHIVPWSEDKNNRLNPQNGLCLSALHDRAYDQGLITVLPNYTVKVSPRLLEANDAPFFEDAFLKFDGLKIQLPERFLPHVDFLAAHATKFNYM